MINALSVLILGPSGSGKSSFANSALRSLGSGAILLAPGMEEENSYFEFQGHPNYVMRGFDDTEYQPLLGQHQALGLRRALQYLQTLFKQISEDVAAGKPPRYAVLVLDTATAIGRLAYDVSLASAKLEAPPAARGGDGAAFYGMIYQNLDAFFRLVRAFKGLGVHIIALGHTAERENVSSAVIATDTKAEKMIVAALPGGFRDALPGFFDLVMYSGIAKLQDKSDGHYLQWKPNNKRPTKSRLGALGKNDTFVIPTAADGWTTLMSKVDAALAARQLPATT